MNTEAQTLIQRWKKQGLSPEQVKTKAMERATTMFGFWLCDQIPDGADEEEWVAMMDDLKFYAQGTITDD